MNLNKDLAQVEENLRVLAASMEAQSEALEPFVRAQARLMAMRNHLAHLGSALVTGQTWETAYVRERTELVNQLMALAREGHPAAPILWAVVCPKLPLPPHPGGRTPVPTVPGPNGEEIVQIVDDGPETDANPEN